MFNRFGISYAPEGCGNEGGACYACVARKVRRSIRQLFPLRYSTYYGTNDMDDGKGPQFVNFTEWRMWFGKVFNHQSVRFRIADGEWENASHEK
jgi:hypothetical protein